MSPSSTDRSTNPMKRVLLFVLKVGVAAAIIYWMYTKNRLDIEQLRVVQWNANTLLLILAGLLSFTLGFAVLAKRLQLLLTHQRIEMIYRRALGITYFGTFVGMVLPGLIGGDAVKAVYLVQNMKGRRTAAVAAVLVDRVIGVYSLFLLGTLAWLLATLTGSLPVNSPVMLVAPVVSVGVALGVWLLSLDAVYNNRLAETLLNKSPRMVRNLVDALRLYLKAPSIVLRAVGLSLANHALSVLGFWMAGMVLQTTLTAATYFLLTPLALVMNMIPLTPGGIGLAEYGFSYLFQAAGEASGALIGLSGRILMYVVLTVGGVISMATLHLKTSIATLDEEAVETIRADVDGEET